jgi:hypothetical protein
MVAKVGFRVRNGPVLGSYGSLRVERVEASCLKVEAGPVLKVALR